MPAATKPAAVKPETREARAQRYMQEWKTPEREAGRIVHAPFSLIRAKIFDRSHKIRKDINPAWLEEYTKRSGKTEMEIL